MRRLAVPLAAEETGSLTLDEWDALLACEGVVFEDPSHPLAGRLAVAGANVVYAGDRGATDLRPGWGLVTDPDSPRLLELAHRGARVTSGIAPSPDDVSAAHAAPTVRRTAAALGEVAVVMARLRSDDGCPWDREQTHESLKSHLLEEAYEFIDSIDRSEIGLELEEELGDVLLQVAFHARLAEQEKRFDLAGVARRLVGKLVHRHPHVFGEVSVTSAGEVVRNWEEIKREEKGLGERSGGLLADLPPGLPALLRAHKAQKRARGKGFDPPSSSVAGARVSAALEREDADSVGEALFWLVALARDAGIDPEGALRRAVTNFEKSLESSRLT
jgi:MazG family protein